VVAVAATLKASRVRALLIMRHAAKVQAKRQIAAAAAYVRAELDAEAASTRSSRSFPIRPRKDVARRPWWPWRR
jgi:hypothetical protein